MNEPDRVAINDENELVLAGVTSLLHQFPDRVQLVAWDGSALADVVLYGVQEEARSHDPILHSLLRSTSATIVAFGWRQEAPQAQLALACGAHGFVSKQLTATELVERIAHLRGTRDPHVPLPAAGGCHPGVGDAGLTPRETDVLGLVASGQTNAEIALSLFLSINSVKTYIRSGYRKIGVERRSQAVLWAVQHGLVDSSTRVADEFSLEALSGPPSDGWSVSVGAG